VESVASFPPFWVAGMHRDTHLETLAAQLSAISTRRALQEVQRTNLRLEHLAATDPLTGVGNRRQFIARIGTEIARAKRSGTPLSLLSLNLDHFKTINDTSWHISDLAFAPRDVCFLG
jgi:PleD family two-component response regulator